MNLQETFGSLVFNDAVMRQRLPKETYKALHRTIAEGKSLNLEVASVVANTMKDWAVEKGATHYTHWFQPMTGITAEKHERRRGHHGVQRQGAGAGRTGRFFLPLGRFARNL